MNANRPRSTLEVPRRYKGEKLEAPKPGAIHNHAPALSEADFDRSKYAHADYARTNYTQTDYSRAEYVPTTSTSGDYNRASYQTVPSTAQSSAQPISREEARRNDPNGWRNDPPPSYASSANASPAVRISTIRISSTRTPSQSTNTARPSSLSGTNTSPHNTETWQQAFQQLTGDPNSGPIIRIIFAIIAASIFALIGTAIFGPDLFWIGMLVLSVMGAKNAREDNTLSHLTSGCLSAIHPKLANTGSAFFFFIILGALSFLMMIISLG